ncbi:MAG: F0F1 ATP synthase subunit delta [Metamycoplasmataceae bacterium]
MTFEKNIKNFSIALFEIANDSGELNNYFNEAVSLQQILSENENFTALLSSYNLNFSQKEEIINNTFKGFNNNILSWLKLIAKNNLFFKINTILGVFIKSATIELKIKSCIVYSSTKLSIIKLKKIEEKLEKKFNTKVIIKNLIDENLISGIRIEVDNQIIETSIRLELEQLSQQLKGAKNGNKFN